MVTNLPILNGRNLNLYDGQPHLICNDIKQTNMDRSEYINELKKLNAKPPLLKTPKGQKFGIGDIVITNQGFWGDEYPEGVGNVDKYARTEKGFLLPPKSYNKGRKARIEYSYYQKYGDHSRPPNPKDDSLHGYSIIFLDDDNSSSWWDEEKLTLIEPCKPS